MKTYGSHQPINVKHKITRYIIDNMLFGDGDKLDETVSFQESGVLDSLGFLELITFIEEKFGIEIVDGELIPENFDTLQRVSHFVQQKLDENKAC